MTTPPPPSKTDRFVCGLDWGGAFGRDPIAAVLAWRTRLSPLVRPHYTIVRELKVTRAVPDQIAAWLLAQRCKDQVLARIWCGADQPYGVAWLADRGLPAIVIPEHGAGSVEAGFSTIASLIKEHRLAMVEGQCPNLASEFRAFKTAARGKGYQGDDHLIDALRYLLISEELLDDEIAEPVPPEKQPTILHVPGVGFIDNPTATHAREMAGLVDDPMYTTWTETLGQGADEQALDEARAFCELVGAPLPDFLKAKRPA